MKKLFSLLIIAFFITQSVTAQPPEGRTASRLRAKGIEVMNAGDAYSALSIFEEALEKDPQDVFSAQLVADAHFRLRDYKKAETAYVRLISIDKGENYPEAQFILAQILKMNEKYDEAIAELDNFTRNIAASDWDEKDYYLKRSMIEKEGALYAKSLPEGEELIISSAGRNINSPSSEFAPYPLDRDHIIFSSMASDTTIDLDEVEEENARAKTYISKRNADDTGWEKAALFSNDIEKEDFHNVQISFNKARTRLFFTRSVLQFDKPIASRIFTAKYDKETKKVSEVSQLDFNDPNYIYTHPRVGTLDGVEYLFFSSNVEGGQGGFDIWYAQINEDGSTNEPLNLGNTINTIADEVTPFVDGDMVYFSSNGHVSIGGLDIFKSKYTTGTFSKPENLGKGFNSRVDDLYFIFSENSKDPCFGYFVSNRPGTISLKSETCCDDIFTVVMPDRCPINLELTIVEESNQSPVNAATVMLFNAETGEMIEEQVNQEGNQVSLTMFRNKKYRVEVSKDGFTPNTLDLETNEELVGLMKRPKDLEKTVTLQELGLIVETYNRKTNAPLTGVTVSVFNPTSGADVASLNQGNNNKFEFKIARASEYRVVAEKDDNFSVASKIITNKEMDGKTAVKLYLMPLPVFHNVYYDFNKANLKNVAQNTLDSIVITLNEYKDLVVEVRGHTDSKGSDSYNMKLSERRAKAAMTYLLEKGIATERLVVVPRGETEPIAPNKLENGKDNPEGRAKNRRTEFKIIKGLDNLGFKKDEKKN